jgi:hypothetical protein
MNAKLKLPENPDELMKKCEASGNWHPLIPYPFLLLMYQKSHANSVREIARIASHRLDRHKFCTTEEICQQTEQLLQNPDCKLNDSGRSTEKAISQKPEATSTAIGVGDEQNSGNRQFAP